MASLRAYVSADLLDLRSDIGEIVFADDEVLVVGDDDGESYYFGDFSYEDGDWNGTITAFQAYDFNGELEVDIRGFNVPTALATVGAKPGAVVKAVLRGDDRIISSRGDDRLAGFDGDDLIRAGGGDDILLGQDGDDDLQGSAGEDFLRGGRGRDWLEGGAGDDILRGDQNRDTFVFSVRAGRDRIVDFTDRVDKIAIDGDIESHRELDIVKRGDDVRITFEEMVIVLRDVDRDEISRGDFLFS